MSKQIAKALISLYTKGDKMIENSISMQIPSFDYSSKSSYAQKDESKEAQISNTENQISEEDATQTNSAEQTSSTSTSNENDDKDSLLEQLYKRLEQLQQELKQINNQIAKSTDENLRAELLSQAQNIMSQMQQITAQIAKILNEMLQEKQQKLDLQA